MYHSKCDIGLKRSLLVRIMEAVWSTSCFQKAALGLLRRAVARWAHFAFLGEITSVFVLYDWESGLSFCGGIWTRKGAGSALLCSLIIGSQIAWCCKLLQYCTLLVGKPFELQTALTSGGVVMECTVQYLPDVRCLSLGELQPTYQPCRRLVRAVSRTSCKPVRDGDSQCEVVTL